MSKGKTPTKRNYLKIKNETYKKYISIKRVRCPYLKRDVSFNSNGFRHMIYRSKGKKRHINTQLLRFKLLEKATDLIKKSSTLQEYESIKTEVATEDHHIKIIKIKEIEYFGFIGIIDGWKLKVVVKKEGNANPIFWSVIPNWTTNRKRDKQFKKHLNHSGDLEED